MHKLKTAFTSARRRRKKSYLAFAETVARRSRIFIISQIFLEAREAAYQRINHQALDVFWWRSLPQGGRRCAFNVMPLQTSLISGVVEVWHVY